MAGTGAIRAALVSGTLVSRTLRPRCQVGLIALVLVLTMATWFTASAAVPAIRAQWDLTSGQSAMLTTSVQLGFVLGALASAMFSLPDRVDASRLVAASAVLAAVATSAMADLATGLGSGVVFRFVTGVALAGVYPVGLKIASSWYVQGRGLALGILVGALTVGSALPQLVAGALGSAWRPGLNIAAGLCLLGAAVTLGFVRVGPHTLRATKMQLSHLSSLARERGPRLANLGYLGHMWELYAVWAWLPTFFVASLARRGEAWSNSTVGAVLFTVIGGCGGLGCLAGGWAGDRLGRARVAAIAMLISGSCCLLAALTFGSSPLLTIPVMAVWGASVIADSAMFSACLASVVDKHLIGTALTFQTAAGFLLTIVTVQGLPRLADAVGWRTAVITLGVGPIVGSLAMLRLTGLLPASDQERPQPRSRP